MIRTLSMGIEDLSYNGPGGSKPKIRSGRVADEVEYEPYRRASRRVDLAADFDYSGVVDVADIFAFLSAWFANDPRSDANGDGVKTTADIFAFLSLWFSTASTASLGPADSVSDPSVGNPYGYCGYYFDAETYGLLGPGNGALYHVRHRVYDPAAGCWLSRDPAGFVDGANLYGYGMNSPVLGADPTGLATDPFALYGANGDNLRAGSGRSDTAKRTANEINYAVKAAEAYVSNLPQDIHDGYLSVVEGGVRAAVGIAHDIVTSSLMPFIPSLITPYADEVRRNALDSVHSYFSDAMYDPDRPERSWSAALGEFGFGIILPEAGAMGASYALKGIGALRGWLSAEPGVPQISCFVSGTLVLTPDGSVPIEDLCVGDRVETTDSQAREAQSAEPADLRRISLSMPNPYDRQDVLDIQLLRSAGWMLENGAERPGDELYISLPEVGVAGWAAVERVDDCPVVRSGRGRLVLATVTHRNSEVMIIRLKGLAEPLEPTATHPLFSEDRQAWVRAGELREGERLRTLNGAAEIVSIARKPGVHRVYNLEVQTEHVYYVSPLGVLAHNDCPGGRLQVTIEGRPQGTPWPKANPEWGRNRLVKELHDEGFVLKGETRGEGGLIYENPKTGEGIRIMPKDELGPPAKSLNDWYYRYRNGPDQKWGPAQTIPNCK